MNSVLTAMCAEAGFVPRVRHEVEETSTLVTLVAAGLGVAIVPDPTAALDIAGVCYRPLTRAGWGWTWLPPARCKRIRRSSNAC